MARIVTFSRSFPKWHEKAGQPTYFVEKIWASLADMLPDFSIPDIEGDFYKYYNAIPKKHTIRQGHNWKAGMKFSPRFWQGKPRRTGSTQIAFGPDIEIVRTVDFNMDLNGVYSVAGKYLDNKLYTVLARNDGLTEDEMFSWFMPDYQKPKEFDGQILIFNDTNLPY